MMRAMQRLVEPEILDDLAVEDPAAVASRRDLRRINFLMGNERWILRQVRGLGSFVGEGILEWGAGSGDLLRRLARFGPVAGMDRVERPAALPEDIGWHEMDVMTGESEAGVLVANLFLHHFEAEALRSLGRRMTRFRAVVAVEPWRSRGALGLSALMHPWVSRVTRHDMPVSIRAGFRKGELAEALGLEPREWKVVERVDWRGGLRWMAVRRDDPCGAAAGRC
jgi:hypothetical protein